MTLGTLAVFVCLTVGRMRVVSVLLIIVFNMELVMAM